MGLFLRIAPIVVAIFILVAGCGGTSDEEGVEAAVKTYLGALAEGDGEKACDQLSGEAQRELVGMANETVPELGTLECAGAVEGVAGTVGPDEAAALEGVQVSDVQISGDTATATISGATVSPELIRFDGRWLISSGLGG